MKALVVVLGAWFLMGCFEATPLPRSENGQGCLVDDDCESDYCLGNICQEYREPQCQSGDRDQCFCENDLLSYKTCSISLQWSTCRCNFDQGVVDPVVDAAVGVDAERLDAERLDAGATVDVGPDGGEDAEAAGHCVQACNQLAVCAAEDVCPNVNSRDDIDQVFGDCEATACPGELDVQLLEARNTDCAAMVEVAARSIPGFSVLCGG